jgi:hypothetical protein
MFEDSGVDEIVRQWTAERNDDAEQVEARQLASTWLAEADPQVIAPRAPMIPGQRGNGRSVGKPAFAMDAAHPAYIAAMSKRLPDVPVDVLEAAASCWQLVGTIKEAKAWWDAGISPLDQRALDYRAAGLSPADLGKHLGPYTVLEHLRKGSAPAWCVARLRRQRRDSVA